MAIEKQGAMSTDSGPQHGKIELTLSLRTEADPQSETVRTFLKAISDVARGQSIAPKQTTSESAEE